MQRILLLFVFVGTFFFQSSGQVLISPDSLSIRNNSFGDFVFNFRENTNRRRYRINYFAHSLWHNSAVDNMASNEYWHLGARNSGLFDLAFGPLNEDNFVDTDNSVVTFSQDGDISLVRPSPRINFYSTNGNEATLKYNSITFELENNQSGGDITLDADDEINLATGPGSPTRVLIEDDGDVGIGTSGPVSAKLEIRNNSTSDDPQLILYETESNDFTRFQFRSLPNSTNRFTIASNPGSGGLMNFFYRDDTVASNAMSIDGPNQRVGINKTSPEAFLHVRQEGAGAALAIENNGNGNDIWTFEISTDDLLLDYDGNLAGFFNSANGAYIATSDRRLKNTIEPLSSPVLPKVMDLRPVSYYFNHDLQKEKPTFGFIAQEVQAVEPLWVTPREDDYLGINYDEFIPVLTKAIQEQQGIITAKEERIRDLENRLAEMENLVDRLAEHVALPQETNTITLTDAELFQNEPNPFDGRTLIRYHIPDQVQQAVLRITNAKGQVVRDIRVEERGTGQVELAAGVLSTGAYQYSLILDGRMVDTKRMIRQR